MTVPGIAQFVADRLTEMQTVAKAETCDSWHTKYCGNQSGSVVFGDCECDVPAAVLRQVAALRLIVVWHTGGHQCSGPEDGCMFVHDFERCPTITAVASMWAGHPDYDTTWGQG